MIAYNPKEWFTLIFQFHKSDTFRILLPTMVVLGFFTYITCYLEKKFLTTEIPALTVFHQISGFIISMVLVFRINSAYDRWWEGRKLWGALVNNSRNLAIKLHNFIPKSDLETRKEMNALISNFPFALKDHLRNENTVRDIVFTPSLPEESYKKRSHRPNYIASQLTKRCLEITRTHVHSPNDYLALNDNLNQFTDISGACERIKSTPIPYSYSLFIKKIVFLYVISMPFAFGLTLGYWAVPIVMIMFYAFASLELISEEIEDPFGTDPNDLPTEEISLKIKTHVHEILLGDEAGL